MCVELVPDIGGGKSARNETGCCIRIMPENENHRSESITENTFGGEKRRYLWETLSSFRPEGETC